MPTLNINNLINISEKTALPTLPNSNFITIEKIVVLFTSIIEEDKIIISHINVE
jgi:hypothetical protein